MCFADECRHMEFRNSGTFLGKRLINHVIKSLEIVQENLCGALCFMENNCVSFNTEIRGGSSSKCELNNASHNEYPQDLQPWTNYTYRGAKVTAGTKHFHPLLSKGWTIRKLMGGGGGRAKYKKNIRARQN